MISHLFPIKSLVFGFVSGVWRLCHFDRRAAKQPEAEKSIKKQISRLRFTPLEMKH